MSGTFSLGLETALLNHVFAGTNYPPPAAIYIALYTAPPDSTGAGGTEVSGGAYVRMSVAFGTPTGNPPLINNPAAVQWPAAQAVWGTIVAGGLFDAPSAGSFLGGAMLVDPADGVSLAPKAIGIGDVFRIPAGNLVVGFSAAPLATSGIRTQGVVAPIVAEVLRPRLNVR
jgi:hypothetical protein